MVTPDEMQHVRSKSECLPSECWREENISRKALGLWFLSLFQNLVIKKDIVFVQPGAKINSVYYCENVFKQGLPPAIRRISNNDFAFNQDGAPCTPFTTLNHLHSNVPEFTELENWPLNSSDVNPADYSVWTAL